MLVVPVRKVGSLVCATGFFSAQTRFDDRQCNVEHPRQLEQRSQLGVECAAVIVDARRGESLLQHPNLLDRFGEGGSVTINTRGAFQGGLHVRPNIRDSFASLAMAAELTL